MLNFRHQRGVSMVEVMVVVVITAIMMAMAMPNFGAWVAGTRIRSTAEGLLAGLQYAKSEAATRNTQVRFQLTTSLGADCARSSTSANWVVDVVDANPATDSVEGQCNAAPSDTVAPSILQVRSATETGSSVQVAGSDSQVIFNGLGRQVPIAPATTASTFSIDVTPSSSSGGRCVNDGGKITCLRILVTTSGQVRMCNPSIASGDPQAC